MKNDDNTGEDFLIARKSLKEALEELRLGPFYSAPFPTIKGFWRRDRQSQITAGRAIRCSGTLTLRDCSHCKGQSPNRNLKDNEIDRWVETLRGRGSGSSFGFGKRPSACASRPAPPSRSPAFASDRFRFAADGRTFWKIPPRDLSGRTGRRLCFWACGPLKPPAFTNGLDSNPNSSGGPFLRGLAGRFRSTCGATRSWPGSETVAAGAVGRQPSSDFRVAGGCFRQGGGFWGRCL